MYRREPLTKTRENAIYVGLLTVQTTAASFLFWAVFPLFRQMIERLGERQDVSVTVEVQILLSTLVLLSAYWARYRRIAVRAPSSTTAPLMRQFSSVRTD